MACKAITKKILEVTIMKILRWSCGCTKLGKIRNEDFRKRMVVTEILRKVLEKRLKWYMGM